MKSQYLAKVRSIPEAQIKALLRKLLPKTGQRHGEYKIYNDHMKVSPVAKKRIQGTEYWHRISSFRTDTMEGLTWVLDLLPRSPKTAVMVIQAYLNANEYFLWDAEELSLVDSIDVIKAKYFDHRHPISDFYKIKPIEFEWLIEGLFSNLGYQTTVTQNTHDKGMDIVAIKEKIGKKEKALIECKRHTKVIGVSEVRRLRGILPSENASRGILITTSSFSRPAIKFAEANSCIELIDREKLNFLLNLHLGTEWHINMKYLFKVRNKPRS